MSKPTVYAGAVICEDVTFGERCVVGSNVFIGRGSQFGDDVRIQHGAFIPAYSCIGNRVFIGPNVTMCDDKRPKVNNPSYRHEPPILQDDCAIGGGATLLPGVIIAAGALVGAGAVVTHSVGPGRTVIGCPAKEMADD